MGKVEKPMGWSRIVGFCGAFVVLAGAVVGCASEQRPDGEFVLANQAPVQSSYVAMTETQGSKGIHLVKAWGTGRKAKSVGTIRPAGEKWPVSGGEANCGATFISDHHAVTAAHCVDKDNLPNVYVSSANPGSPFRVEQIDTTNLNLTEAGNQTLITGGWPNYTRANPLTAAEGYVVNTLSCHVKVRCDSTGGFGRNNCPTSFGSTVVDIALIYCPGRSSAGDNWAPVASSDSGVEQLEIWWFHELVFLATGTVINAYQPYQNYNHYYFLGANPDVDNYHYRNDTQNHQLLPLVSWRDVTNVRYHGVESVDDGDQYTNVNVPACHGTSGSGVFKAGAFNEATPQYLGPVVHSADDATNNWGNTKLCDDAFQAYGNVDRLEYAKRIHSSRLEALVLGDR
jgi:hypothetical protein